MSNYTTIKTARDERGVATVTLARPEVRNAMNGTMWVELRDAFAKIATDPSVRIAVLTGEGTTFCSGGDLRHQGRQQGANRADRITEAHKLAHLLQELDALPKPLIARVNGSAFAGGTSLVAVADVTIGTTMSQFAITEARIGMVPGMISSYVTRRVGISNARRLFLTARQFSGVEAVELGLLHRAVPSEELDAAVEEEIALVLSCAPGALATIKQLLAYVSTHQQAENFAYAVDRVVEMWGSPEAKEGVASFLEKRKPSWAQ